ncbi:hypothetical protein HG530_011039 [Fusarium avenaceum]|nr:hypothetical protein HG530_011039 [Fusarium avenaceum]
MVNFKKPFGSSFFFSTDREKAIHCDEKPLGLFTTVEASSSVEADVPYHNLLSNTEKDELEEHLGRSYLCCWRDDVMRLRAIFHEKTWFGFDLDDNDIQFMDSLLESYEHTLTEYLQLKCGALCLLSTIKNMDKKIVIITEDPQDAQERTIQALGIGEYLDFIATTNHLQVSKTSGLFKKVLGHLGISPGDMAYIGDKEKRDMEPAMAKGIFSVHLDETRYVSLNAFPPQVNTLMKLQYILSDDVHSVSATP